LVHSYRAIKNYTGIQQERFHENPADRLGRMQMNLSEIPEDISEVVNGIVSPSNRLVSWVHFVSALQATAAL